jgi:hypothetical protein
MSLTLKVAQRLEGAGLVEFFDAHKATWLKAARQAHDFVAEGFPDDATIRRDDVRQPLLSVLEVHKRLRKKLADESLKQKYWVSDFTDLVIDRTWQEIHGDESDDKKGS